MRVNLDNFNSLTPSWVIKAVAALTIFLQLLTPVIGSTTVLNQHTKDAIDLICKILNIAIVAVAPLIGNKDKDEADNSK